MAESKNNAIRPMTTILILASALIRLIPHPANLTPIGALGLFAGGRLTGWQALAVPLVAMGLSDLALLALFGTPPFDPFVYGSLLVNVLIGRWLRDSESPVRIAGASLLASVQFFLVSNFGVWLMWSMYPHTPAGLLECYVQALPFFHNTVLGDLAFSMILFGAHAWLAQAWFVRERLALADDGNAAPAP